MCCVVTGNVSCLFGKNRWIFSEMFACLTLDWNCIGQSTIDATRRNYKSDSTWRGTEKIITFIPVFTTQCPPYFLSSSAFSFTLDGCDVRATCLSLWLIGLIISLLMCEAVSSSHSPRHKPTNGLFQIEWRQIIPRWHRRVSVIIIRGWSSPAPLTSPVTNYQLILFVQIACTVCWFEKHIFSNLESNVIRFLTLLFQVAQAVAGGRRNVNTTWKMTSLKLYIIANTATNEGHISLMLIRGIIIKRGLIVSTLISEFSKQHDAANRAPKRPNHLWPRCRCISQKTQSQIIYCVKQESFENRWKNELLQQGAFMELYLCVYSQYVIGRYFWFAEKLLYLFLCSKCSEFRHKYNATVTRWNKPT